MELTTLNVLLGFAAVFTARIGYIVIRYYILSSKIPSIPMTKSRFPILKMLKGRKDGYNTFHKEFFDENDVPHPAIRAGPGFRGEPRVWFSDPDAIKELLTNTEKFTKYKPLYGVFGAFLGDGLVCTFNRDIHKKNRKLITPLFHYGALKAMISTINNVTNSEIQNLRSLNGQEIEARQIEHWTMRIIIAVAFGDAFPVKWMATTYQQYTGNISSLFAWDFLLGGMAHYLPTPFNFKRWSLRKQIEEKILEAIQVRRTQLAEGTIDPSEIKDLLTLLLTSDDPRPEVTIIDEGLTFLFAGYDTTSKLLQWTFYYLAKYPDIQAKVRDEVNSVLADSDDIEDSHLQKLSYCKNVLNESLRLRPPVNALPRTATEDCVLSGVFIPKGTTTNVFIHGAHLDPKYWENPREFRPERWDEKNERHAFAFVPFSAGERNCIGQKLANQEALMIMALIVKNFRIESSNLEEVKMGLDALLTPMNLKLSFKPLVK